MKRFVLILVLALSFTSAIAQAMVVKDKAFYQSKSFTWKDASGVSHTNTLAEEATNPRHIMALLKEVYTNKTIPGTKYATYNNGWGDGRVDYYMSGSTNLSRGWDVKSGEFMGPAVDYTPSEEGFTTILIKVKQGFVASTEDCLSVESTLRYIASAIESAQVICGTYVNGDRPGTLYKLEGETSRFFVLSKGRARSNMGNTVKYAPFWGMFEEYSPTAASNNVTANDFYAKMMQGDLYYVVHDCGSVFDLKHEFNMTADKDVKPLDDVAFYIPDMRFAAWSNRDYQEGSYMPYTNYNPDYAPVLGMYNIKLTAQGEQAENESEWKVTLNWTSNLNTITGCDVPQTYFVYIRKDDGTLKPLLDENGNQVTTDNVTTYTYNEEKNASARTITYVVSGRPKDDSFSLVYSNDASVVVPGMGQQKWALAISVTPVSDFDINTEVNQYKNYVSMNNNVGTSIVGHNLNKNLNPKFTFYRYPENHSYGVKLKVATVNITDVVSNGKKKIYKYVVEYANQDGADPAAYPSTTGEFTCDSNGGEVDFGDFQICDQFFESTANNSHPASYEYCVEYTNDENVSHSSQMERVKVFKTMPETNDQPFSQTYVENDNVRTAHANEAPLDQSAPGLTFDTENNSQIYFYKAMMQDTRGEMQEVGRAQRMPNGNYMIYNNGRQANIATAGARTVVNGAEEQYGTFRLTPVIHTFRAGAGNDYNTYGAPIRKVTRLGVKVQEVKLQMSDYTFTDKNGVTGRYYKSILNIPTQGAVLDGEIARYRVWRITPDGKAMEVAEQYMPRLNQDGHPADMYVYAGGPVLFPSCKNEFIVGGDDARSAESCFPIRYDENTITFTDVFGAKVLGNGEEMPVTYVVRVYAIPAEAGELLAPAMDASGSKKVAQIPADMFYIAENTTEVKFTNSIPTAVFDIDAVAKTPLRVQYVNMLGCASDTPFEGLNIVVTTFNDGTMMKEKKMY